MKLLDCIKEVVVIPQNIRHYDINGKIIHLEPIDDPFIFYIDPEFAMDLHIGDTIDCDIGHENQYLIGTEKDRKECYFTITKRFIMNSQMILHVDF